MTNSTLISEATAEQIAMAQRIAEETRIDGPLGLGSPNAVKAALAAIIETQRLDAELAETFATFGNRVPERVAGAIREGRHYGKNEGREKDAYPDFQIINYTGRKSTDQ